jgi:hypothetical protein
VSNLKKQVDPDGTKRFIRPKFVPLAYTTPSRALERVQKSTTSSTYDQERTSHEGFLREYTEADRFERDGKTWVLLMHPYFEHFIEAELQKVDVGEKIVQAVAVPPEKAYEYIKKYKDAKLAVPVVYE